MKDSSILVWYTTWWMEYLWNFNTIIREQTEKEIIVLNLTLSTGCFTKDYTISGQVQDILVKYLNWRSKNNLTLSVQGIFYAVSIDIILERLHGLFGNWKFTAINTTSKFLSSSNIKYFSWNKSNGKFESKLNIYMNSKLKMWNISHDYEVNEKNLTINDNLFTKVLFLSS